MQDLRIETNTVIIATELYWSINETSVYVFFASCEVKSTYYGKHCRTARARFPI